MSSPSKTNSYVVLWSSSQNSYHTDTIAEMLEANRHAHLTGKGADYIVLAFADSYSEAAQIIERLHHERLESQSLSLSKPR